MNRVAIAVIAATLLLSTTVSAAPTDEQECLQQRYLAAAKYALCQQKA